MYKLKKNKPFLPVLLLFILIASCQEPVPVLQQVTDEQTNLQDAETKDMELPSLPGIVDIDINIPVLKKPEVGYVSLSVVPPRTDDNGSLQPVKPDVANIVYNNGEIKIEPTPEPEFTPGDGIVLRYTIDFKDLDDMNVYLKNSSGSTYMIDNLMYSQAYYPERITQLDSGKTRLSHTYEIPANWLNTPPASEVMRQRYELIVEPVVGTGTNRATLPGRSSVCFFNLRFPKLEPVILGIDRGTSTGNVRVRLGVRNSGSRPLNPTTLQCTYTLQMKRNSVFTPVRSFSFTLANFSLAVGQTKQIREIVFARSEISESPVLGLLFTPSTGMRLTATIGNSGKGHTWEYTWPETESGELHRYYLGQFFLDIASGYVDGEIRLNNYDPGKVSSAGTTYHEPVKQNDSWIRIRTLPSMKDISDIEFDINTVFTPDTIHRDVAVINSPWGDITGNYYGFFNDLNAYFRDNQPLITISNNGLQVHIDFETGGAKEIKLFEKTLGVYNDIGGPDINIKQLGVTINVPFYAASGQLRTTSSPQFDVQLNTDPDFSIDAGGFVKGFLDDIGKNLGQIFKEMILLFIKGESRTDRMLIYNVSYQSGDMMIEYLILE